MTGRLVAEFRYGIHKHVHAFERGGYYWFAVRLGKKRTLVCDCGGVTKLLPGEHAFDSSDISCSHLVALFLGDVTDDKRVETRDYEVSRRLWALQDRSRIRPHFARLTQLGQKMFYHRWVARAL